MSIWIYLYFIYTDIMAVVTGPLNSLSSFTVAYYTWLCVLNPYPANVDNMASSYQC